MYKVWEAIDTEKTAMTTKEYAQHLSDLTGRVYSSDDITYMCRENKLPKSATAHKEENSSLWTIVVKNDVVPKARYIELAERYNALLATVQAVDGILERFLSAEMLD